jgi:hypothetical protein
MINKWELKRWHSLDSGEIYLLAIGYEENDLYRRRVDYALKYLYGDIVDCRLDKFPKERIIKESVFYLN